MVVSVIFVIMVLNWASRRRIVLLANIGLGVVLLAAVLLFARDMVRHYLGGKTAAGQPAQARGASQGGAHRDRRALDSYAPILTNNVFGFDAGQLTPLASAPARGEAFEGNDASSASALRLLGTVAWPGGMGYAFISGGRDEMQVYRQGDLVTGSMKLISVEPNQVVLLDGGRELKLPIAEIANGGGGSIGGAGQEARKSFSGFARMTSENSYVLDRDIIQSSFENPKNIMTDARLLPNIVDGQQQGFVVKEVKREGIYYNLGIRNGDVLLKVNDFEISDAESALQAFNALKGLDSVNLDIIRGGQKQTLTYELR